MLQELFHTQVGVTSLIALLATIASGVFIAAGFVLRVLRSKD